MSDLCYSVRPSVRLSRNSCSRKKPTICHETQEGPSICHETQEGPSTCHETLKRGRAPVTKLKKEGRGQPLREGFHIVKVRAKRPLSSAAISRHLDLSRENLAKISQIESPQYRTA